MELVWLKIQISPELLERVKKALQDAGCTALTISDAAVVGRQTTVYRGATTAILAPRLCLEIGCAPVDVKYFVEAVNKAVGEGRGEASVFVLPMQDAIRVRNGISGKDAL